MNKEMNMSKDEVITEYVRYEKLGGPEGYFTWHEYLAYDAAVRYDDYEYIDIRYDLA
jgi:hypothetical protein